MYNRTTDRLTNGGGTPLEHAEADVYVVSMQLRALVSSNKKSPCEWFKTSIVKTQIKLEEYEEILKALNENN